MGTRDVDLARAFDGQAAAFERAPVQSDSAALERLVAFAALPPDALVLDAGCGPGLVAEAFLRAGYRVQGIDLSPEMVRRARARCAPFGDRASFEVGSTLSSPGGERFDGAVSRLVLHHVDDPLAFVRAMAERVRPGGAVVVCDHVGDPEPPVAAWHQRIEQGRDRTHVRSLTTGELVDLLARLGLRDVRAVEEPFELDFDEWFDRGTPALSKADVRALLLAGSARAFAPTLRPDGGITIRNLRALVRGAKPA